MSLVDAVVRPHVHERSSECRCFWNFDCSGEMKDQKKMQKSKKKRRTKLGPQKMMKVPPLPLSFWRLLFTGLTPDLQESVLDGMVQKTLSLGEAKVEIKGKYLMQQSMNAIVEQLKLKSWGEALKEFKDSLSVDVLHRVCTKYAARTLLIKMTRKEQGDYSRLPSVRTSASFVFSLYLC